MVKRTGPTNPQTRAVIEALNSAKGKLWADLSSRLGKSRRQRHQVNLSRISRHSKDGETIVVPGKVLGSGALSKKVTVAALEFSASAKVKISENGKAITITELLKSNKSGKGVRIIG